MQHLKTTITMALALMSLAGGLPADGHGKTKPGKPQPQAMVLDAVRDFGFLPQRAEVSHTFWLQNRGRAPLNVSKIKAGCSCTSASKISKPINPGDSAAVEIRFRSGRYRGKVHKKTTVFTNDPMREELELHIIATVVEKDQPAGPVMVEPFRILLVAEGDTIRTQVDTLVFSTEEESEYRIEFSGGPQGVKVETVDPGALTAGAPVAFTVEVVEPQPTPYLSTASFGFRVIGSDTTGISVPVTIEH